MDGNEPNMVKRKARKGELNRSVAIEMKRRKRKVKKEKGKEGKGRII